MGYLDHLLHFAMPLVVAAGVTIEVSAGAFALATTLGLLLASIRFFMPSRLVRIPISIYVEVFRNVPSLTHLFIISSDWPISEYAWSLVAAIVGLG
jgi:polar amino acid transport system permease protein